MRFLIGVDDTDNLESRGTGHRARQLGEHLASQGVLIRGITRHQLLVSPEIPYTSHNSSACLDVEADAQRREAIWQTAREFLLAESAPGSDAGLCLAGWEEAGADVQAYGLSAKQIVLTQNLAHSLAAQNGIGLEGLTGSHGGVIGALAAVGLRAGGNDGRFLWLARIRDLVGAYSVAELLEYTGLEAVMEPQGRRIANEEVVQLGEWNRPILRAGLATLLVEEVLENGTNQWRVLSKEQVKQLSQ